MVRRIHSEMERPPPTAPSRSARSWWSTTRITVSLSVGREPAAPAQYAKVTGEIPHRRLRQNREFQPVGSARGSSWRVRMLAAEKFGTPLSRTPRENPYNIDHYIYIYETERGRTRDRQRGARRRSAERRRSSLSSSGRSLFFWWARAFFWVGDYLSM